jgi:ankyrin repeat protein
VHGKYNDPPIFISDIQILLGQGALLGTQNERGETPLLEALESGALFAAELLLEEAAKARLDGKWLCGATIYGETALHEAARKGLPGIVSAMLALNNSASLTRAQDLNGDTALHLAAGR